MLKPLAYLIEQRLYPFLRCMDTTHEHLSRAECIVRKQNDYSRYFGTRYLGDIYVIYEKKLQQIK